MGASAKALLLFVPVASDAPASSGAPASVRRPRLARSDNDGENNASIYDKRVDAPDADPALQSGGTDRSGAANLPRRIASTHCGAHQPQQHPRRPGAARLLALTCMATPPPARAGGAAGRRPRRCSSEAPCIGEGLKRTKAHPPMASGDTSDTAHSNPSAQGDVIDPKARRNAQHALIACTSQSNTVGASDAIEPRAGAAKLAATNSGFAAQVNRGLQHHLDNRAQSRAPAAHWERVSPSAGASKLDAKNPALGLNQASALLQPSTGRLGPSPQPRSRGRSSRRSWLRRK
jgi:hypothetical protein